jgi:hypothetical protein
MRRLLLLNGLAAIGVVVHHAAYFGFHGLFEASSAQAQPDDTLVERIGWLNYLLLLLAQLDHFALPAFMFISGFFAAFAFAGRQTGHFGIVTARLKFLVGPVLVWNVVHFALLMRLPRTPFEPLGVYYYVTLLAQYYVLAPAVVRLAQTHWKWLLVPAGLYELAYIALSILDVLGIHAPGAVNGVYQFLQARGWLFPNLAFWFVLGVTAGVHRKPLVDLLLPLRRYLLIGAIAFSVLTILEYVVLARLAGQVWIGPSHPGLTPMLYALCVILFFVAAEDLSLPYSKALSDLGTKSLGVYLVNVPAMYVLTIVVDAAALWMLYRPLVYPLLLVLVGLGAPLVLMAALRSSPARSTYRYVFG